MTSIKTDRKRFFPPSQIYATKFQSFFPLTHSEIGSAKSQRNKSNFATNETNINFCFQLKMYSGHFAAEFSFGAAGVKNEKKKERNNSEACKRRTCARRKFLENWKIINWQTTLKKLARSARMLPSEIFFFLSFPAILPPPPLALSHSYTRPAARRKLPSSLILINLLKKFAGNAAASALLLLLFLFRVHAHSPERRERERERETDGKDFRN